MILNFKEKCRQSSGKYINIFLRRILQDVFRIYVSSKKLFCAAFEKVKTEFKRMFKFSVCARG